MKVCLVDALSTGQDLAKEFHDRGVECFHVRTSDYKLPNQGIFKRKFSLTSASSETEYNVVKNLKALQVDVVLAGSEMGVEVADKLSTILSLKFGNKLTTTPLRRNKYRMQERLRECGLSSIKQFMSSDITQIITKVETEKMLPVVVKPLEGAASNGVAICESIEEVEIASRQILGHTNILGALNEQVLVQEFLDGEQYFVNCVSCNGDSYVTDIWLQDRVRRSGGAYNFIGMHLMQTDSKLIKEICDYTLNVLDCLDLKNGASHNEIMVCNGRPVLIETNARLMGASIPTEYFKKSLEQSQVEALVDVVIGDQSPKGAKTGIYSRKAPLSEISLLFKKSGVLRNIPKKSEIQQLRTFIGFSNLPQENIVVSKTEDTLGEPGFIYLAGQDEIEVATDYRTIQKWQSNDEIFEID
ncbi:biotin carboxylase [Idiomarina tyrosinivorans]|uniref:Biotin carboxylase n=1 Tax=Idiomarina tyrosinivorans TaxID=1445662 RepID=A0A432ZSU5_9GAMM|nr:ATP-grasp domain-containing protein [Idiomarina tyrosinivorans]RUO80959.1 biotin carboxylase [Idiomarina tyrosinivorans]